MPDATVRFRSAPGSGDRRFVPGVFMVSGLLGGADAEGVTLTLVNADGDVRFDTPRVFFIGSPQPLGRRAALWVARIDMKYGEEELSDGAYRLYATPTLRDRHQPYPDGRAYVDLYLRRRPRGIVGIDYPPEDHTVEGDELNFFYTTGPSDIPVWNAFITKGTGSRAANYTYWVSELGYWVAEFLYLSEDPGSGYDYTFYPDTAGAPSRTIHIASPE